MTSKPKDAHIHKFKPIQKKVLLGAGRKHGYDILKQLKCDCGKLITNDLERVRT